MLLKSAANAVFLFIVIISTCIALNRMTFAQLSVLMQHDWLSFLPTTSQGYSAKVCSQCSLNASQSAACVDWLWDRQGLC